jgi:hypothetical protein
LEGPVLATGRYTYGAPGRRILCSLTIWKRSRNTLPRRMRDEALRAAIRRLRRF